MDAGGNAGLSFGLLLESANTTRDIRSMGFKENLKTALAELVKDAEALVKIFNVQSDKFRQDYHVWYTKALRAVERLAPDRYEEFRRYYEPSPGRLKPDALHYTMQDFLRWLPQFRVLNTRRD